jgi:hypothetical protein
MLSLLITSSLKKLIIENIIFVCYNVSISEFYLKAFKFFSCYSMCCSCEKFKIKDNDIY